MKNYRQLLHEITTFIFDYDGVLTDGTVYLLGNGDALRTAHVKDGYALQYAMKKGYRIAIISGAFSESVQKRFESLKVSDVFLGVERKLEVYEKYCQTHNLQPEQILYMGDDIPDLEVMQQVGIATCPSDAAEEIKAVSKYISHQPGGRGCVRDVIEQVLKVQGKWMNEEAYGW